MIDASKFAKPLMPTNNPKAALRFGLGKDEAVSGLHQLIEMIEDGRVLLQKVQSGVVAGQDDYCMQALYIEFAEYHDL